MFHHRSLSHLKSFKELTAGAQAPKRTAGGSWMSELGKRQG